MPCPAEAHRRARPRRVGAGAHLPAHLERPPIVVRAGSKIQLRLSDRFESRAQVTCDGTAMGDLEQAIICMSRSRRADHLLHPPGYDYYRLLRSKLHWAEAATAPVTHADAPAIADLVIVDQAELEFKAGLTALTGETGAGKSIVVDALLLISGGRAGGTSCAAAPSAPRSREFRRPSAGGQSLARSAEHRLRRRSRAAPGDRRGRPFATYVNGQVVPIQALRELAEYLIEIHGQQEFQRLVNRGTQREMLDEHLADKRLLAAVSDLHGRHRDCRRDFEALRRQRRTAIPGSTCCAISCRNSRPSVERGRDRRAVSRSERVAGRGRLRRRLEAP